MFYLIYKITNTVNGKIYVGMHKTSEKNDNYMGSGVVINRAIDKYGIDMFTKEILYECQSEEEMIQREADIVNTDFLDRSDTYNLALGGKGGGWYYIQKNKLNNIGNIYDDHFYYHKQKMKSDSIYRDAVITKQSNSLKVYYMNNEFDWKGKQCNWNGRTHSNETKRKIGDKNSIIQKGSGNSRFGCKWIHDPILKINKSINISELSEYLSNGWLLGRKIKWT